MQTEPCGYRVIVKPDPVEDVSAGGIVIIHDEKRERAGQIFGTLVKVGSKAWDGEEPWAKIGDRVMFSKYSGKTVEEGDERFLIINDEDIIAIVPHAIEDSRIDGEVTS